MTISLFSFIAIILAYIPVGALGYGVYGDLVSDNIFDSISTGPMKTIATILITMHLVFAYVIIQNPLSQIIELPLNIPDGKLQSYKMNHISLKQDL